MYVRWASCGGSAQGSRRGTVKKGPSPRRPTGFASSLSGAQIVKATSQPIVCNTGITSSFFLTYSMKLESTLPSQKPLKSSDLCLKEVLMKLKSLGCCGGFFCCCCWGGEYCSLFSLPCCRKVPAGNQTAVAIVRAGSGSRVMTQSHQLSRGRGAGHPHLLLCKGQSGGATSRK